MDMTTIASLPADQLYANSFWSTDRSGQEILIKQNEKATKTLGSLSTFYREFANLESEYARKFNSLVSRLELPKHEYASTVKTSLDVFQEQCLKMSESHSLQARKVQDSLQLPLNELIGERKAHEKAIEARLHQQWSVLNEIRHRCQSKSAKYEEIWSEMSSLKSSRMTLDNREIQKLEQKLETLKSKMLITREENWASVQKYNSNLEVWTKLWWETCNEWQRAEEKRIRFLKTNLWEFANICSSACVEEDQYAENIRNILQDCSARKDINCFVGEFHTGNESFAPMKFVDFAKHETRPVYEENKRKFNISDVPAIQEQVVKNQEGLQRKRNPPPELSETTATAFSFIGKSKETFKELQEEAQKEASQMKLDKPKTDEEKSISEPSTFKAMSDYSNPTTQTSISSTSMNENYENNVDSYLFNFSKSIPTKDKSANDTDRAELQFDSRKTSTNDTTIAESKIFNNNDILRDSMAPVRSADESKSKKHNSFAHLIKNVFNEYPTPDLSNSCNDEKLQFKQIIPTSKESSKLYNNSKAHRTSKHRKTSSSIRKSKSQYELQSRQIPVDELPLHSSEGYAVIAHCKAQYNYTAAIEEELSFRKRDIILVLHKQPDGWWFAENLNSGDSGLVPSNYLKEIK